MHVLLLFGIGVRLRAPPQVRCLGGGPCGDLIFMHVPWVKNYARPPSKTVRVTPVIIKLPQLPPEEIGRYMQFHLTESVYKVVLHKSIPAQIRTYSLYQQ